MTFIKFLFIFFLGLTLIVYREKVQRFTGNLDFAEKYLGDTFNAYLLIGLILMVGSIFYITGILDGVIDATVGKLFLIK